VAGDIDQMLHGQQSAAAARQKCEQCDTDS